MDKIIINQGIELSKDGTKFSPEDFKGVFTTGIPQKSKDRVKPGKKQRDRSWETIDADRSETTSSKALSKSRSDEGGENDYSGRTTNGNSLEKIFDHQESEFSQHAIDAGRERRLAKEMKKKKNHDWAVNTKAKTTSDVPATQMGFTPNRSAYQPGQLPSVNIPLVDQMILEESKSAQAGIEAGQMLKEIYQQKNAEWEAKMKGDKNWEDETIDQINSIFSKESNQSSLGIKLADDLVNEPVKKEVQPEFKELFTTVDGKQKSIKVDLSHLKSRRKSRKDDRSWETIENSKSRKY